MEPQTFDLGPNARVFSFWLWLGRGTAIVVASALFSPVRGETHALATDPYYQVGVACAFAAAAVMVILPWGILRIPPIAVTVDARGLSWTFSSGKRSHLDLADWGRQLRIKDSSGLRSHPDPPGRPGYWIAAGLPPFGMRMYPLSDEAMMGILWAAEQAGLRVSPDNWRETVVDYRTFRFGRRGAI